MAAVGGEPIEQRLARETLRFGAALGRDQLLGPAGFFRQRLQLIARELRLDEVALLERLLLVREKLPRFGAARSTRLSIIFDHLSPPIRLLSQCSTSSPRFPKFN
jgi:hypothetical protein